jgi:tetratricopeptide (TPR) repeat protein
MSGSVAYNHPPVLAIPLLWLILSGFGGPAHEGSALQREGNHQGALEKYKKAQESDPENKALDYNMGGAYHNLGEFEEAAKAFERAAGSADAGLSQNSIFNRGVSLYRAGEAAEGGGDMERAQKMYSASAGGYKALLKTDPKDAAARHNLELALAKIKEMEEKKKERQSQPKRDQSGKKDEQEGGKGKDDKAKDDNDSGKPDEDKSPKDMKRDEARDKDDKGQGMMTPEEARMTLDAVNRDEMELKRALRNKMIPPARRPEKDW